MTTRNLIFVLVLLIAGGLQQLQAQCTSDAGTILNPSDGDRCTVSYIPVENVNAVIDSGDIRLYVIHDGTTNSLGNIIFSTPFANIWLGGVQLQLGETYQVGVLVGDAINQNTIDLNDPCLSLAGGISFTLVAPPTIEVDVSGTLTCGGSDVTLTANISPPGNYTLIWEGLNVPANTNPVTVNQPTLINPTVFDSSSMCWVNDTVEVVGDETIPTLFLGLVGSCGEFTITANTNNPDNTFEWSNGVTNPSIIVNDPGTYCVTVTSPEGCTTTGCRFTQFGQPLEVEVEFFGGNVCFDSLGLFAGVSGGNAPYSYLWSTGETGSFILPFDAGNYSVTVTDNSGCTAVGSYFLENGFDDCGEVNGKVYADENTDCAFNGADFGLQSFTVRLEDSNGNEFFTGTDANGDYQILLPPDTYDVSVVLNNSPWAPCQASYTVNVPFGGVVTQDHPLQADAICPSLEVDISNNFLRRCASNIYYLSYCNNGTLEAQDAYIDLTLEPFLILQDAELPFTDLGNDVYRFELGNLGVQVCGDFWVRVFVSCDAVLGQTHCAKAEIFPNDPCPPADPDWSGASVQLRADCTGDEVQFFAENTGNAAMTVGFDYVIIEDAVMMMQDQGDPLGAGEERLVFTAPANGSTWRLEADQEPLHPGQNMPSVTVEGCTNDQNFSIGFVNQFENNDNDPWKDIDCRENVGSFDPNDKQGFPTGYGNQRYIRPGVDIEYLIRFQNTGTDTAFLVVIRDTLDSSLDPGSVRPGASSHPYTFEYYDTGFLKFTFDPIALPDSNVNLEGSQGFVTFKVSQRPDVALETDIFNTAAIYFDANEPVITNTTRHRVGENFITVGTWNPTIPGLVLKVMPNPAISYAVLQLDGIEPGVEWQVEVLDALGRTVRRDASSDAQWRLNRGQLPSGQYLIRVWSEGRMLGTGKVMLK